jgi:hypothetical protein
MNFTKQILTIISFIGIAATSFGQLPNYLPTSNLVAWYPFNGNTNDESGNNNHLTNNGPTPTLDRFGNCNSAFYFAQDQNLFKPSPNTDGQNFTWSLWMKKINTNIESHGIGETNIGSTSGGGFGCAFNTPQFICQGIATNVTNSSASISNNLWYHYVITKSGPTFSIYINGILNSSGSSSYLSYNSTTYLKIGGGPSGAEAEIDDIAMWNEVLSQAEISELYNATSSSSGGVITMQPINQNSTVGNSIEFSVSSNSENPTYQWQSNPANIGWTNLEDNNAYLGSNTTNLTINNLQINNHNQEFRVILTSGNCIDTSDIASISILDTCITSITDTTYITVTDTLFINTLITGINPPNNSNTIKVYPNPANSHITIEYGDFAIMNGYQLRIENSLGQEVFQTSITQQSDYLNLNSWGGNGLYFVHIVDPQGNTIDIRKIVLQ